MIEGLILAAATVTATAPAGRVREGHYIIVSRTQPVSTQPVDFPLVSDFLTERVTTYQYSTPSLKGAGDFISPIKRSFSVTATIKVSGRVVQPPVEEEIVYFEE
jgi:hypothetical protein